MSAAISLPTVPTIWSDKTNEEAAELLKAMANGVRLRVLHLLSGSEMSVSQLNSRIEISQSALSQHLAILRRSGIVVTRRESQTIYYSLGSDPRVSMIMKTLS